MKCVGTILITAPFVKTCLSGILGSVLTRVTRLYLCIFHTDLRLWWRLLTSKVAVTRRSYYVLAPVFRCRHKNGLIWIAFSDELHLKLQRVDAILIIFVCITCTATAQIFNMPLNLLISGIKSLSLVSDFTLFTARICHIVTFGIFACILPCVNFQLIRARDHSRR